MSCSHYEQVKAQRRTNKKMADKQSGERAKELMETKTIELLDMLVVAPHPDDAELGMGGAIAKMIDLGWHVGVLDLTNGEPIPYGSLRTRLQKRGRQVRRWLYHGVKTWGSPTASQATLEARAKLANVIRRVRPKWLFAPYWENAPSRSHCGNRVDWHSFGPNSPRVN